MLEQDLHSYKIYYERPNRKDAFKKVKGENKNAAVKKFVELIPGKKILRVVPVIVNQE